MTFNDQVIFISGRFGGCHAFWSFLFVCVFHSCPLHRGEHVCAPLSHSPQAGLVEAGVTLYKLLLHIAKGFLFQCFMLQ